MSTGGPPSDSDEEYLTPEEADAEEMRLGGRKAVECSHETVAWLGKAGKCIEHGEPRTHVVNGF